MKIKKSESHKNLILVGILLSAVIGTTSLIIIKMSNAIIDNQGNGYQNAKTSQGKMENVSEVNEGENINKFLADARQKQNENTIQTQKQIDNSNLVNENTDFGDKFKIVSKNGDIVIGYVQRENRNQEFLKIGNQYKILNTDKSDNLKSYAEEITAGCNNDEWCEKSKFFDLIKKIPYQTDPKEGWKYDMKPIEVLNYNKGDCDERSFTLASLLLIKNYKSIVIYTNNHHAFLAINIKDTKNINPHHAKLRIKGLDYYYAETTDQNAYIGAFNKITPKDFIGVYDINKKRLVDKREIEFYEG